MKIIKLSLAALVIIVAAGTSAFKSHPAYTGTWFAYTSATQTKAAYNTATNYSKLSTGGSCVTDPLLCQIKVPNITHTAVHGVITIPSLPTGFGTKVTSLNDRGTVTATGGTYVIATESIVIDFTD